MTRELHRLVVVVAALIAGLPACGEDAKPAVDGGAPGTGRGPRWLGRAEAHR